MGADLIDGMASQEHGVCIAHHGTTAYKGDGSNAKNPTNDTNMCTRIAPQLDGLERAPVPAVRSCCGISRIDPGPMIRMTATDKSVARILDM